MLRRLMAAVGVAAILLITPAFPGHIHAALGVVCGNGNKQLAFGKHAVVDADGGRAWWDAEQLSAADWADFGFAAEVLWVGTNGDTAYPAESWVEVGNTDGWAGTNVTTFYTARAINFPSTSDERRISSPDPILNHNYRFQVQQDLSSMYTAKVFWSSTGSVSTSWTGHTDPTVQVVAGLESTCSTSTVSVTKVTNVGKRANVGGAWSLVATGTLVDLADDPDGGIGWCNSPTSYRYYLNSLLTGC